MIDEILFGAEERMEKAVAVAQDDFGGIRPGRATPQMFQKIVVDYYGAMTPIIQLASLTVPEPRMAVITPYDKQSLGLIERAIRDSDLGVNPSSDGKTLRCVFPELTEERRKEYIKIAKAKAEDGRVAVRNLRRTAKHHLEKLEKDHEVGQDDVTGAEKRLDGMTKKHTDEIDEMLKNKEAELIEV